MRKLESLKEDKDKFTMEIIQLFFGYIARREKISTLVDLINEVLKFDEISVRFLVGYIL